GRQTNYLIGLTYPGGGRVWVAATRDPNDCVATSNGEFSSSGVVGPIVNRAFTSGRWPTRQSAACNRAGQDTGRLGQDAAMVPPRAAHPPPRAPPAPPRLPAPPPGPHLPPSPPPHAHLRRRARAGDSVLPAPVLLPPRTAGRDQRHRQLPPRHRQRQPAIR